jgi:hypothetical protein
MKNSIFFDIMLCSPVKASQRFGGTYHFHLWGAYCLPHFGFFPGLLFNHEDGGDMFL